MNYERAMENFGTVIRSIRQAEDYIMTLQAKEPEREQSQGVSAMALRELKNARNWLDIIKEDLKK